MGCRARGPMGSRAMGTIAGAPEARWACRTCKSRRRGRHPSPIRAASLHRAQESASGGHRSSQMVLRTCVRCKYGPPGDQPATVLAFDARVRRLLASNSKKRAPLGAHRPARTARRHVPGAPDRPCHPPLARHASHGRGPPRITTGPLNSHLSRGHDRTRPRQGNMRAERSTSAAGPATMRSSTTRTPQA